MRIAIVGAGSIGGYLAARLILSGQPVTVIARGANLAAIRSNGLTLRMPDGTEETAHPELATRDSSFPPLLRRLRRSWVPRPRSSPRRTESPGGTSSAAAGRSKGVASSQSTRTG